MTDTKRIDELERRVAKLEALLTAAGLRKVIKDYERRNGPGSFLDDNPAPPSGDPARRIY